MAHKALDIPKFIQAQDYESTLHAETGSWIVILARKGQMWRFRRDQWQCIRFNVEHEEIKNG